MTDVLETCWADEVGQWTARWDSDGKPVGISVVGACPEPGDALVSYVKTEGGCTSASGPNVEEALWHMTCALVQFIAGVRGYDCWPGSDR